MKLDPSKLKAPADTPGAPPANQPSTNQGGGVFLAHMVKASGVTRKELQYEMRWSDTYIDMILSGEKNDPISQARKICTMLRLRNRMDLIATIIVHIAGGDDFDGRVLTAAQTEALRELAKALNK